jgi:protein-S-isoprenylcysteine O-methyltransferase Ste14
MLPLRQRLVTAFIALPGTVTIVIPGIILLATQGIHLPIVSKPCCAWSVTLGFSLLAFGLFLALSCMSSFARVGEGTLAPWDPPKRLVVDGVYRHVRNPMISGIFCILFAEALIARSNALFFWFLLVVTANCLYIPFFEESSLERRYGQDYLRYKKNVPRWIPRFKPWSLS